MCAIKKLTLSCHRYSNNVKNDPQWEKCEIVPPKNPLFPFTLNQPNEISKNSTQKDPLPCNLNKSTVLEYHNLIE